MKNIQLIKTFFATIFLTLFAINASAAGYMDDASVTAAIIAKLTAEKNLPATDIKVSTYQGIVQLSGFVDTKDQVNRAGKIAKTSDGVKSVSNDLLVKTKPANAATQYAKDSAITTKVKTKLAAADDVSATQIGVNTYNGVVQLSGFVDKGTNVDKAADVAKNTDGVTKVVSNLIFKEDDNK